MITKVFQQGDSSDEMRIGITYDTEVRVYDDNNKLMLEGGFLNRKSGYKLVEASESRVDAVKSALMSAQKLSKIS